MSITATRPPASATTRHPSSEQFEENHALWWTIDGIAEGQEPQSDPRYHWTQHPVERWSALHRIRLSEDECGAALTALVDEAVKHRTAVHAHVSDWAGPTDLVERLRDFGFQHYRRFPVFGLELNGAGAPEVADGLEFEEVKDLSGFDIDRPHPATGPVDTDAKHDLLDQLESRVAAARGRITHHVAWDESGAAGSFVLIRTGAMVGFYDPSIADGGGVGVSELLDEAVRIAIAEGFERLGTICDRADESAVRGAGFAEVGWLSWLGLSKAKVEEMAG